MGKSAGRGSTADGTIPHLTVSDVRWAIAERTMAKDRQPTFDAFRGLAIIAVIALHCMDRPPGRADEAGSLLKGVNEAFIVLWKPWLVFAVPVFLFISGYFLGDTKIASWADYRAHLKKRLLRILVPMFVWWLAGRLILAAVFLAYSRAHGPQTDTSFEALREQYFAVAFAVGAPYYYLIVLAQLYILLPVLAWLNRMELGRLGILAFCIAWLVLRQPRLELWTVLFVTPWLLYYQLGMLIGRHRGFDYGRFRRPIVGAFIALGVVGILMNIAQLREYVTLPTISGITPTQVAYSCSVILLMLLLSQARWAPRWLVWLGGYSFGIYLIHMLFLAMMIAVTRQVDWLWRFHPLYHAIVATTTLAMSVLFMAAVRRVVPERICQKYLGF